MINKFGKPIIFCLGLHKINVGYFKLINFNSFNYNI